MTNRTQKIASLYLQYTSRKLHSHGSENDVMIFSPIKIPFSYINEAVRELLPSELDEI
jgi:hypothetical protein